MMYWLDIVLPTHTFKGKYIIDFLKLLKFMVYFIEVLLYIWLSLVETA